jgi:ferric-dicitrate binding protein FerR (iron transport regulator)
MPKQDVLDDAAGWLAKLVCATSVSSIVPALNAWLREDKSHRTAFEEARRAWRLAKPFCVAAQSGAGSAEVKAFFEALDEERCRSPKDFADS